MINSKSLGELTLKEVIPNETSDEFARKAIASSSAMSKAPFRLLVTTRPHGLLKIQADQDRGPHLFPLFWRRERISRIGLASAHEESAGMRWASPRDSPPRSRV